LLFGVLATAAVLIGLVTINVLIGQSGVREATLQKAIDAKQQQADLLQVDVLRLSAPARIYQRAQRIGMVPAGDVTYIQPSPPAAVHPSAAPSSRRGGD
jgi:cell division protein FtsL